MATKKTAAKAETKTTAKKTAAKKAETAPKAETKAEPKVETKVETKAAPKAETKAAAKTETKAAAKKPAAKKAEPKFDLYIQFGGATVSVKDIEKNVKKVVKGKKAYTVYVKPDESKAYFVADGQEGEMDVFFC